MGDLPLDVLGEIRKGRSEPDGVILGGDAVGNVGCDDVDTSASMTSASGVAFPGAPEASA